MAFFVQGEYPDFYLSAGIAIEHAMKTRLARENPAFLAPDKGFKSAVALWVTREDTQKLPIGTRTISALEALSRVVELQPSFARHNDAVHQILRFRNGEAHLGAPGSTDHVGVFASFLRAIGALLRVPIEKFWGEHAEIVALTLDETAAGVSRDVAAKLASARLLYRRKFDALHTDQRDAVLAFIAQDRDGQVADDRLRVDCPACKSPALLVGSNRVEFDVEFGDDNRVINAHPYLEFHAHAMECAACHLVLDGQDEIEASNLDAVLPNDDANVDEYMREYYEKE